MLIDCDTCVARDIACGDCVMTVLLGDPARRAGAPDTPEPLEMDDVTQAAIGSLSRAGLVPPLRLVRGMSPGLSADDQASA